MNGYTPRIFAHSGESNGLMPHDTFGRRPPLVGDTTRQMKHMELLTNAIARLSNTSVLVKGWGMALVVGLLALAAKDSERGVMAVAFLPIAVLCLLDAYYLLVERGLRTRFKKVSNTREAEVDFNMSPEYSDAPFRDYGLALCSFSVWPFWLMLAASTRLMIWFLG